MNGNKDLKYFTDFLFPKSSFLTGAGSIFNVKGNYYLFNFSKSDEEADSKALESDWGALKQDFDLVVERENNKANLAFNG
jgi:hypothetical protein